MASYALDKAAEESKLHMDSNELIFIQPGRGIRDGERQQRGQEQDVNLTFS